MPNYNFQPLIAGGFDQLGQQQQQWAGFNRGVEEGNMQRAAAAQQAQNNWLAQRAQMQQSQMNQDLTTQLAADQQARQAQANQAQQAESRFQFNVGTKQYDEAAKEKKREFELSLQANKDINAQKIEASEAKFGANIEDKGQRHTAAIASTYVSKVKADNDYQQLLTEQQQLKARQTELTAASQPWYYMGWPTDAKKQHEKEMTETASRLAALGPLITAAKKQTNLTDNNHQKAISAADNNKFDVHPDSGDVVDRETGKRWNFKTALNQASTALQPGGTTPGWTPPINTGTNAPVSAPLPVGVPATGTNAVTKQWKIAPNGIDIIPK